MSENPKDVLCPICGEAMSVNWRDGKPYDYCTEHGEVSVPSVKLKQNLYEKGKVHREVVAKIIECMVCDHSWDMLAEPKP